MAGAEAPTPSVDLDAAAERVEQLGELLFQLQTTASELAARLDSGKHVSSDGFKEIATAIPVLGGHVQTLESRLDAVQLDGVAPDGEARQKRRRLIDDAAALSEKVQRLPPLLASRSAERADSHKAEGNAAYKAGKYDEAIARYTDAIGVQRHNPVFWSNRSAVHQAKGAWKEALSDAKECVSLDVGFLKGYLHCVKCQLQLGRHAEAATTLHSAPLELRSHTEITALKATLQESVKAAGNAAFKASKHDEAEKLYTTAIGLDGASAVFHSNRSAVRQARARWRDAASDAAQCVKLDPLFVKGHVHLGRCLLQTGQVEEAKSAVQQGMLRLQEAAQPTGALSELMQQILAQQSQSRPSTAPATAPTARQASGGADAPAAASAGGNGGGGGGGGGEARGAALKERGNAAYKAGQYAEAIKLYSQAIGEAPGSGAYYGNRAAAWMMLSKYTRAVGDCAEAMRREGAAGELGKVRCRYATALTHVGKLDRACDVLQEGAAKGGEHEAAIKKQLATVQHARTDLAKGRAALADGSFALAKRALAAAVAAGVSDDASVRLELARSHLGAREPIEAAREAQKAMALESDLMAAYVLRAEALQAMGMADKAQAVLREALQRDPDNEHAAQRLKRLKRLTADTARVFATIEEKMAKRRFEEVAAAAGEGLRLDEHDHKLHAKMHDFKAKAYQMIARTKGRGETRAQREAASGGPSGGGGGGGESVAAAAAAAAAAGQEEEADPRRGEGVAWRVCLQEAGSALYNDAQMLRPYLLKAEALQGLERWGEAQGALEACINNGPGAQERSVHEKLHEAQFLVKKAQRPDLYKLLGVPGLGAKASEKEIRSAYKRAALEWHPDRHSDKSAEARKEAEVKFKELGEALDVLTDEFKRKLWDEGHDLESIAQRVQMRDQQQGQR